MKAHTKKIIKELCHYLGEDIDHPMCQELQHHVEVCPECRSYIETIRMTIKLYKSSYPEQPAPPDVKAKILDFLKKKQ